MLYAYYERRVFACMCKAFVCALIITVCLKHSGCIMYKYESVLIHGLCCVIIIMCVCLLI